MATLKLYLLLAFCICLASSKSDTPPSENSLIQAYLKGLESSNYDSSVPPDGNHGPGSPVEVRSTMFILDVHKVNDLSLDYTVQMYFRQVWNDTRLQYRDLDINYVVLNDVSRIWTPDLFFVEEKQGRKHNIVTPNVFIRILPNGEVKFSVRLTMTFSCPMDLAKYPHDVQNCTFSIESYGFSRSKVLLKWDEPAGKAVGLSSEVTLLDFEITGIEASSDVVTLSQAEYTRLEVSMTFKRRVGFFVTRLYVPFILLVPLSWLSFFIKPKLVSLRLSLLLVIMYIMISIGRDINSYVPPAPYTKGSDVWIGVCETLVFAAFLELLAVSLISKNERKLKKLQAKNDPESPQVPDSDSKTATINTDTLNSAINIIASRLKNNEVSHRLDKISRIVFPILFLLFNIIYWSVYCRGD